MSDQQPSGRPSLAFVAVGTAGSFFLAGLAWYYAHTRVLCRSDAYCYALSRLTCRLSLRCCHAFEHVQIGGDHVADSDADIEQRGGDVSDSDNDDEDERQSPPFAVFDEASRLVAYRDVLGPLVLCSVPTTPQHIAALRAAYGRHTIDIYSLSPQFERDLSGLSALVEADADVSVSHKYPTPDFAAAPSIVDLVRAVADLRARSRDHLAVVQSKSAHDRSVVVLAAYMLTELEDSGIAASIDQIEGYLQSKKPSLSLRGAKAEALRTYANVVRLAGSFAALQQAWSQQILQREYEVIAL